VAKAKQNLLRRVRQNGSEAESIRLVQRMSPKKKAYHRLNKFGESVPAQAVP
jgi:hypothetical protein